MSEQVAEQATETAAEVDTTEVATETTETAADPAADLAKWKALARKHEQQAKANADKAKAFDAAEEASKSELQKLQDRLAASEKAAQEATVKALRAEVAQSKGLPAALLTGDTLEALEAAADELLAWRGAVPTPPVAPSAAGQGKVGAPIGAEGQQLSREQLKTMTAEQIVEAKAKGQLTDLLSGRSH